MARLEIYPDIFCRDLCEFHEVEGTLEDWLRIHVPSYQPELNLISVLRNGQPFSDFAATLSTNDQVQVFVRPAAPLTIISLVITAISIAYQIYQYFTLKTPKTPKLGTPAPIYDANVQANQPRLREPIPEIFGRHPIFPDYISQPWREYIDHEQWIHLLLCVGIGRYEINSNEIYIGNTPIDRYGADVDYTVFEPGEDVTGHIAHKNIYTTPEVGQTSSTQGITLKGPTSKVGQIGTFGVTWDFVGTTMKFVFHQSPDTKTPNFGNFEFLEITSSTTTNDGKYRIDSYNASTQTITVTKMLDDLSDVDPLWTAFTEEHNVDADVVILDDMGGGSFFGPYLACPLTETTSVFYVDFTFPNGLYRINRDGEITDRSIDIEILWRDANGSDSFDIFTQTFTDDTQDARAYTIPFILDAPMTPEVKCRRITTDASTLARSDHCIWVGLRSELLPKSSYANETVFAISVKGSNVLAAQSENQFNLIATRKLPEISGGVFGAEVPTRKISSVFRYICNSIGVTDSNIDLEELQILQNTWDAREDTFDAVLSSASTFFETLKQVLRPGYSVPLIERAQLTAVRDEIKTVYEQMYQPDNMLPGGNEREITLIDEDEPDGIEVSYFDVVKRKFETVMCLLPGDAGDNPDKEDALGITDRTHAWRLGMRIRRERRYRRAQNQFSTELDALNSRFGSFCALGDDMLGHSITGVILDQSGTELTLSQNVSFTPAGIYYLAARNYEGNLDGPHMVVAGSAANKVILATPLGFTPIFDSTREPSAFQFGILERFTEPVLVTDLQINGVDSVDVTAVNYDSRVYDDDDNPLPDYAL